MRISPRLCERYNILGNKIIASTSMIKNKDFEIVEDYSLEDSKWCFDSDDSLICSICLEDITNHKITFSLCPHCNKYVGHIYG